MYKSVALLVVAVCAIDAAVVPKLNVGHHLPAVPNVFYKDDRIIGGTIPPEGEFKYQIGMLRTLLPGLTQFSCGGSVIGPNWVLTAAHCVNDVLLPSNVHLRAGEQHLDVISGHEQERDARRIIVHPDYNAASYANDIALIEVNAPYEFNDWVQPIALPDPLEESVNTTCIVSGWGTVFEGGPVARQLHAVEVPTVSDEDCANSYATTNPVVASMLCAGTAGKDSCQGDSGGPLTCDGAKTTLHGIVSWGVGCAQAGYPGVYTQVSYFRDWIAEVTGL